MKERTRHLIKALHHSHIVVSPGMPRQERARQLQAYRRAYGRNINSAIILHGHA